MPMFKKKIIVDEQYLLITCPFNLISLEWSHCYLYCSSIPSIIAWTSSSLRKGGKTRAKGILFLAKYAKQLMQCTMHPFFTIRWYSDISSSNISSSVSGELWSWCLWQPIHSKISLMIEQGSNCEHKIYPMFLKIRSVDEVANLALRRNLLYK